MPAFSRVETRVASPVTQESVVLPERHVSGPVRDGQQQDEDDRHDRDEHGGDDDELQSDQDRSIR